MTTPSFETDKVSITVINNGIYRVIVKENVELDLADLDTNYFFLREHIKSDKVPFLIIFRKGSTTAKGALERFKEKGRLDMKKKEAFVLSTLPHRIITNFYMKFSKQNHPTKIFSNEIAAIKWLEE